MTSNSGLAKPYRFRYENGPGMYLEPGDCLTVEARHKLYEKARRHGLSHEASLDAVGRGPFWRCWCGKNDPCVGGALRHIGCAIVITPEAEGGL